MLFSEPGSQGNSKSEAMGGNSFRFKRFTIEQEGCAMKVGTDGVLLGAWCRAFPSDKRILDIGTGTGVITLQLAQRTEQNDASIDAVEIDPRSNIKARDNFQHSEWKDRITLHPESVQEFAEKTPAGTFDNIVSNPPYFIDSLTSSDTSRNTARHAQTLSYAELMTVCARLLKPEGRISLILPIAEAERMMLIASENGLYTSRRTEVWSTPKSGPKRLLLELSHTEITPEFSSLVIEDAGPHSFSKEYRALTCDFYLHF